MNDQNSSDNVNHLQPNEAIPPDQYAARITGSRETIIRLMHEFKLDVGCRPHPELNPDGSITLLVYATEEDIRELQVAGYSVERGENVSALGQQRQAEVGHGDRFEGGRVAPRGLGEKRRRHREGGSAS